MNTSILGLIRIMVIFSRNGVWEGHEELQKLVGATVKEFTEINEPDYNHAKAGYTAPLVKALNVTPQIALQRMGSDVTWCHFKSSCREVSEDCWAGSGSSPSCYLADAPTGELRVQLNKLVHAMLQGGHVVIVCRT